jgi:hypothetical protein
MHVTLEFFGTPLEVVCNLVNHAASIFTTIAPSQLLDSLAQASQHVMKFLHTHVQLSHGTIEIAVRIVRGNWMLRMIFGRKFTVRRMQVGSKLACNVM